MVEAKAVTDSYNIALSGNIPLTTKMLLGTQQDNMKFVIDLLDSLDLHNFILAPGCDMPYDTPIDNVVGCMEAVRHPEETRQVLKSYAQAEVDLDSVALPDYAHLEKPLVELFTLDSASCAACMYMVQAAQDAVKGFPGQIDLVEYKFTKPENVARVMKMGVQNLPSLYINGKLKYSSLIPDRGHLVTEFQEALSPGKPGEG
jgi:uroporphyrinogen decarboxylase